VGSPSRSFKLYSSSSSLLAKSVAEIERMFSSTKTFSKKLRISGALSAHSSLHAGLCLRNWLIPSKSTVLAFAAPAVAI
jgi:hypothetical protein